MTPRPRPGDGQAYLLLTLCEMSWGANAVAGRLAVGEVSRSPSAAAGGQSVSAWIRPLGAPELDKPQRRASSRGWVELNHQRGTRASITQPA